jgi:hypothetical protein
MFRHLHAFVALSLALLVTPQAVSAQGVIEHILDRKGKAFRECSTIYEEGERRAVLDAAATPQGTFGSTYIRRDKGEWMATCMNTHGFERVLDSLAALDSRALARMSREQISTARKSDRDRAAESVESWRRIP